MRQRQVPALEAPSRSTSEPPAHVAIEMRSSRSSPTEAHAVPIPHDGENKVETMQLYLPMAVGNTKVLINKGADHWLVDNSVLNNSTSGLGYRRSKKSDDRVGSDSSATWGTLVRGVDTGDGWLLTNPHELPDPALQKAESKVLELSSLKLEREATLARVTAALANAEAAATKTKDAQDKALQAKTKRERELEHVVQTAGEAGRRAKELTRIQDKLEKAGHEAYVPLKEGQIEHEDQRLQLTAQIKTACKEAGMDDALFEAAEKTLIKDPDTAFGTFETSALDAWEAAYYACLDETAQSIKEANSSADVEKARALCDGAETHCQACLRRYNFAQTDQKNANAAVENAASAFRDSVQDLARATAERDAEVKRLTV